MNAKLFLGRKLFALVLFTLLGYAASAQDSAQKDSSLLVAQQEQGKLLLNQADSIHIADSVQQAALLAQINDLKAGDEQEKAKLQARLDSLRQAQEVKAARIKAQVDSLRASTPGKPVVIFGDTVFFIYSKLGPFSAGERAASIAKKVKELVGDDLFDPGQMRVVPSEESHDVMHGEIILLSITDRDAFWLDTDRKSVADQYSEALKTCVAGYHERTGLFSALKRIGLLILVLALFFFGVKYMNKGFTYFNKWLLSRGERFMHGVKFKNYEFLSKEQEEKTVVFLLRTLKWISIAFVVYLSLPIVFSIFPATKGLATTLFGYVLDPLVGFGSALIGYIPELIAIIVIVLVTRYFVRFLKFLSFEVESGKLHLPGFYPDWAAPTFNLLRIVIYAFSFIVIFPYLPGSDSPVFQGVSVFLGVLISLGSSSAIGNIIAGLVITYMRAFKIGDRVKIADVTGDVIEKTMLVTRLRTIKNEDVTIPNSAIMNGSTVNYSTSAQTLGLILNTTITIGYDVPWKTVHELLINAALKTDHVKDHPQPFVLQTSLDDFYVSYQINAYTEQAGAAAKIYSQLHSNIQDGFNEAGVEILSPHYRAARDGNQVTIPPGYLPSDYQAPAFNVKVDKKGEL